MDLDLTRLNDWLENFINFERHPNKNILNLSTMQKLCDYFGHPENSYKCFHVGGSKGKGTISANIASILNTAGYKVGIYASPHVYHFTERVSSATGPFSQDIYDYAENELRTGVNKLLKRAIISAETLTWFELVTMFAMLSFRKAKVDYAIFEVGMGGRLDTTNIINPICIAMGPIELEHTKYLGDTITKIATEKAGIFKLHTPIISAPQTNEAKRVLNKVAEKNFATITYVPDDNYQIVDANIAHLAVKTVLPDISNKIVLPSLDKTHLPARYEKISLPNLPYILIDGAHTVNSIKAVLDRMGKDRIHGNLLFGCAADKNVEKIAKLILDSRLFTNIYLTKPGNFKNSDLERTVKAFNSNQKSIIIADSNFKYVIKKAISDSISENLPLIVLGSFYLAGEVKIILDNKESGK